MILFLIGFMGSGKSHYAKALAAHLDVPCFDLDAEIEMAEGKKINQIFADQGESYFRSIESAILKKTVAKVEGNPLKHIENINNIFAVIACGGGTPCFEGNMAWMKQHGFTIWINPSVHVLAQRLNKEKDHRPLIKDFTPSELEDFIHLKLNERSFYYSQANLSIENPVIEVEEIVKHIGDASDIL